MSQNGKGDSTRKKSVTEEIWSKNWERIFGKKSRNPNRTGRIRPKRYDAD